MSEGAADRIQQLFLAALEMPEEERAAWLAEQCGDDQDLLSNVRSLLDHDEPDNDPLEKGINEAIVDFSSSKLSAALDDGLHPRNEKPTIVDSDQFLAKLSDVGVLSSDEFDSVSKALSSEADSSDPRQLASNLVLQGKLTQYQASALLQGQPELLIDKYLILDLIDVGGMGMVFKAIHRTMNRVVAIKMISHNLLSSADQVKRFQREVRVAATLEHPNIVRSYDADQANGVHFLVMEYVRGANLHNIVREKGPLSLEEATDCILQAAKGMSYAHSKGIIHRDIKPGNLMLANDGLVKLLDLGLANIDESLRVMHQGSDATVHNTGSPLLSGAELTVGGTVLGTVSFMSPEQSLDAHLADSRSDIYSLGCTFYFLLTGEAPYRGETIFKVFVQHRDGEVPSIRDQRPDVPNEVEAICHKMLAKQPDDRYQSMSELIVAIQECNIDLPKNTDRKNKNVSQPTTSPDHTTVGQAVTLAMEGRRKPKSKTGMIWGALSLVLLAMMIYGGYRIWKTPQPGSGNVGVAISGPGEKGLDTTSAGDNQRTPGGIQEESSMSAAELLATGQWEWQVQKSLGPNINSSNSEWGADMTADGLTIVFSSEREGGHGSNDLWMANRSSTEAPWSKPVNMGSAINTDSREENPAISPDGLKLSFSRLGGGQRLLTATRQTANSPWSQAVDSNIENFGPSPELAHDGLTLLATRINKSEDGTLSRDLWIGKRSSLQMPWKMSMLTRLGAPVNTDMGENAGTLSEDGRLLFFVRPTGTNPQKPPNNKIFMSIRTDWNAPWSDPVQFSPMDGRGEQMPRLLPGGKAFLFVSNRLGGEGHGDIWMAKLVGKQTVEESMSAADLLATGQSEWRVIKKLDAPVNSPHWEWGADMTADGLTIVFTSGREGGHGDRDLWMATRDSSEAAWSEPFNLGSAINTDGRDYYPVISPDGLMLMFTRVGEGKKTFVSTRSSTASAWSQAVPHEITVGHQSAPDMTPDGLTILVSKLTKSANGEIPLGIWISRRSSRQDPWSKLTPVGFPINTDDDEVSGTISSDGRLLIFQRTILSEAEDGKPTNKLWMASRTDWDAPWSDPVPFAPLDKSQYAGRPRLLPDGKSLLFYSNIQGERFTDIWLARLVRKEKNESSMSAAELTSTSDQSGTVSDIPTNNSESDKSKNKPKVEAKPKVSKPDTTTPKTTPQPWSLVQTLLGHTHDTHVVFSNDGARLISASYDGTIKLWNTKSGESLRSYHQKKKPSGMIVGFTSVDIDPTGKTFATAHGSYAFRTWNTETGEEVLHESKNYKDKKTIYAVQFNTDGSLLALASQATVQIWDMQSGKVSITLEGMETYVSSVAFNWDSSRLAAVSAGKLGIWDVKSGESRRFVDAGTGLQTVAFSPDGKRIAVGGRGVLVTVWDATTGKRIHDLQHTSPATDSINSVAFSSDGKYLASGSQSGSVRIWDANTAEAIQTLKLELPRSNRHINSVTFSPDSRFIAVGSSKGIEIWTTASHSE